MSSTESAFNAAAKTYDQDFTQSAIGRLQRKRILEYMDKHLDGKKNLRILELNCGTGYDALYFLQKGHRVLATDFSSEMLNTTKVRCQEYLESRLLKVETLDLNQIDLFAPKERFDLVFSNFAGLNCLDQSSLKNVMKRIGELLSDNGHFIGVLLSRSCLWEQVYFGFKREPQKAFRRKSKEAVVAQVSGGTVDTYYFNPEEFLGLCHEQFKRVGLFGVGIAIPPSYLESAFKSRPIALGILNSLEKLVGHFSLLADRADHYLIDLKKTP